MVPFYERQEIVRGNVREHLLQIDAVDDDRRSAAVGGGLSIRADESAADDANRLHRQ